MIYDYTDYKLILKNRIKELQNKRSSLTMKNIANQLGIQATYFSKFFNQEQVHLSDDHLFLLLEILEFSHEEIEYVFTLKSFLQAQVQTRKNHLFKVIEKLRKEKRLSVDDAESNINKIEDEMKYLLSPICLLVHLALYVDEYRKMPFKLCDALNLTTQQFQENLRILAANEIISLGENYEILEVKSRRIHYGKGHPLMRVHQALLKTKINSELLKIEEKDKQSMLVTFTADEHSYEKMKEAFQRFMREMEEIAKVSNPSGVYQLNFDLFKWF